MNGIILAGGSGTRLLGTESCLPGSTACATSWYGLRNWPKATKLWFIWLAPSSVDGGSPYMGTSSNILFLKIHLDWTEIVYGAIARGKLRDVFWGLRIDSLVTE